MPKDNYEFSYSKIPGARKKKVNFKCGRCDFTTETLNNLKLHIGRSWQLGCILKVPQICSKFPKIFTSPRYHGKHKKKRIVCVGCEKAFANQQNLLKHQKRFPYSECRLQNKDQPVFF